MEKRIVKIVGNSREEREAALNEARKQGNKTLEGGLPGVPAGTHLFTIAENNIFGVKEVSSPTKGLFKFPTVAGVMTISGSGEKIVFDNRSTNNLVIPEKFHPIIKGNQQVYLTIGTNSSGWKEVTNVVRAGSF
jgi:hypothetical protein